MNPFKRLFRRIAVIFVTLWARRTYNQGVQAAELRYKQTPHRDRRTIYLAANSFHPDHLVTYDKVQFKNEKRAYGVHARLLTMNTLKQGCYYYTADKYGNNGMSAKEKEIRRRAFIQQRLRMARLLGQD
jgi:hypothetical protein